MISDIFGDKGALAQTLNGYEPRKGQQIMAEAVSALIEQDDDPDLEISHSRLLLVEAETGIGKTLAYLIPALLSGKRVVVSTATLNLQDQIMNKEVPLLAEMMGTDIPVICLKGRQNYLCRYRWNQYYSAAQMSLVKDDELARIGDWLGETKSGDRAELDWLPDNASLWYKISAKPNQCLGGECPDYQDCFVNQVRKQAGSASLIVVNHHLFFSDLALRQGGYGEVLPRYEGVIFDEAHHIEAVATTFFGKSFSQYQLLDLFGDIAQQAEHDLDKDMADRIMGSARGMKKRTEEFASLFPAKYGSFHLSQLVAQMGESSWRDEVELVASGLRRLADELQGCEAYGEGWASLERRTRDLRENLLEIAFPSESAEDDRFVHWYERRERSVLLSATPIDVADHLEQTLYSAVNWCVLTSATLTAGGDFSYVKKRLGVSEAVETLKLTSPFDYAGRSLVYVPDNSFPEPNQPDNQEKICMKATEMLLASGGRGLVLCTSFRGMDSMAEFLRESLPYTVLVQGEGSRSSLLKQFQQEKESVLVAVASFWEGVDVPGDALSCVIIDKLPFDVPSDPVVQARSQAITEQGGKPFFEFQVPRAVLSLRQGVGRLMRSSGDWGTIAIMDVRLFTKGYGAIFRKSLPRAPIVRNIESVIEFYKRFESEP